MAMSLSLSMMLGNGGASGSSVSYSPARGFHMPMEAFFGVDAVTIRSGGTNGKAYTFSFWIFGPTASTATNGLYGSNLMVSDPTSLYQVSSGTSKGLAMSFDSTASRSSFNFNNSVGTNNSTDAIKLAGDASAHIAPVTGQWNHYLFSWDSSVAGRWVVYKNGVDQRALGYASFNPFCLNCEFDLFNANGFKLNGYKLSIGAGGLGAGWYADVWVAQEYVGNASNTVDASTLAKFYDIGTGRAVDLGTTGTGPTGSQPEIWIRDRGDGVPSQAGQANATFAYGPVVAEPSAGFYTGYPAPFGPGPAALTKPYCSIVPQWAFTAGSNTSQIVTTGSQPVADGDWVVIGFCGADGTNLGTHDPTVTGFTRVQASTAYDTANKQEAALFYKQMGVGEGNSAGKSFTVSYAGLAYTSRVTAVVYVFKNVASIDQAVMKLTASGTNIAVDAGNTTKAQTLLTFAFNGLVSSKRYTPPGTGFVLHRMRNAAQVMCVCEYDVAASASYVRTITDSTAEINFAASLGLSPT